MANIGLGTAKNISLKWHFDTLDLVLHYDSVQTFKNLKKIDYSNGYIKFIGRNDTVNHRDFNITKSIKYINGPSQTDNYAEIQLPDLYLRMWAFYNIIQYQYYQQFPLYHYPVSKFPCLYLNIGYYDINNQYYTRSYKITVSKGFTVSTYWKLSSRNGKVYFDEVNIKSKR